MSWGLGWKRSSEIFHLTLYYGTDEAVDDQIPSSSSPSSSSSSISSSSQDQPELGSRIDLDWNAGDEDDQAALRLQSQVMVALPLPQDTVTLELIADDGVVVVDMKVVKRIEPLRALILSRVGGSGQQSDGIGVLTRLLRYNFASPGSPSGSDPDSPTTPVVCSDHWKTVTAVSLCGCGLSALPVEITRLPILEKLYLDNNKLHFLPPELGDLIKLKVLRVDYNMLVSVPVELRLCVELVEVSLEHNKLVRPLLDFRAMSELRVLRLFGNPLEFLPEILPLHKLRHLSVANIRIEADDNLRSVNVLIETENSSYFVASRHKLSAFFALIFRFSSCHHPLLASALAKIMKDDGNRAFVGKDENAVRQLISMISSDNKHVVEQACSALSSLASDVYVAMCLMKSDIMKPIERVLRSIGPEELISVLQVVVHLALTSDFIAQKLLTKDVLKSLKLLCAHENPEVQKFALLAVGNLGFCLENRQTLVISESLREILLQLTISSVSRVSKAAARALAILGENEYLRRAIRGRQMSKKGLRILAMDGGGMKGLATVRILKEIEKGSGKRIHEMFDLICGTSTGGMLAVALGIKLMSLEKCEEIYKKLGKLVFAETVPKDNEAATWREKLDQIYKSSSQSFRVVVHGSKHSADQFERLLKEMCADDDGDLLIESAVKNVPKVFVVSTLVSVVPAQPFIFRNYQYPVGTSEIHLNFSESSTSTPATTAAQVGFRSSAFLGSCRHPVWEAIRASSAAPYYLDDFSHDFYRWQDGAIVANNPTVFAIREAQLLWPDSKIDCLVSIGCGTVPTKVRKGGWRYLDTGQVLIESACSVDRVEEALNSLLPMLPEIQYFRFNPVDERCDMELDETDPGIWMRLEAATDEYIRNNSGAIKDACEKLLHNLNDNNKSDISKSQQVHKTKWSKTSENTPTLGWRRNVLLLEASHSLDSGRVFHHARSLEHYCSNHGIRLSVVHGICETNTTTSTAKATASPAKYTSPFTSPLVASILPPAAKIDSIPPSLDAYQSPKSVSSPPPPCSPISQLSSSVRALHDKLKNSSQVGVIHLALQNDKSGSILSWENDVFVVAEPGELADRFVQSVKQSLQSMMQGQRRRRKYASAIAKISTVSDLVSSCPYFQVGCVVHRYIGRQTQVMEDDQEIGAFMFRRTVPCMHLTPDDIRRMMGDWRDRIIICTGVHGPTTELIKSFLESGAKAVICPSNEPPPSEIHYMSTLELDKAKFEIGDAEMEDEEDDNEDNSDHDNDGDDKDKQQQKAAVPASPGSDWEDSETECKSPYHSNGGAHHRNKRGRPMCFWDEDDEELSHFICQFYDSLFKQGKRVDVALSHALAEHRSLRYSCHLPTMP